MKNARYCVLSALIKIDKNNSYSNLLIDSVLTSSELSSVDRPFAVRLFYGVIERRITLDACIKKHSKAPLSKLDTDIKNIIRIGLYQLIYMDSVPDSAAVNETVNLCGYVKKQSAKGYVNAVLRSFIRENKTVPLPSQENKSEYFSVAYSCPVSLVKKWIEEYGEELTEQILKTSVTTPPIFIRVNTLIISPERLKNSFADSGINAFDSNIENSMRIVKTSDIEQLEQFKKGWFHVQDISSQKLCSLISPKKNEIIFDMCSAPGGKTATIAQMNGSCYVKAFELHPKRVRLVNNLLNRLNISNAECYVNDASKYNPEIGQADKVLCDVPCSGYGVIRRKPEIKYKSADVFDNLIETQSEILETSSKYVKPGGLLIYSTCTLNKMENDDVAERFLNSNNEFKPYLLQEYNDYKHTFFPDEHGGDGFFAAFFERCM